MTQEKITGTYNVLYPVMEMFTTLQGEGHYSGQAAYFIRLAGCDVGCVWCDVKASWDVDDSQNKSIDEILRSLNAYNGKIVVITGGEPAIYDLLPLTMALQKNGYKVHLETSGAYRFHGKFDWVTLSPKKFKPPVQEMLSLANELKVVIFHPSDLEWAEKYEQQVNVSCKLFLQPEYSKMHSIASLLVNYILEHPQWKFSLQTHKYIGIP